ncbi:NAD(P)H-dependent oxidoreductase [Telmatospirillum sp.]|uniref:flavodoxin family protein n=1 Tax=Telmatospirillum sp. TaxID=2079197 RepID=UPI00283B8E6E|nr:NAD(P)H-dependent oxidoreductase [Telmatospirillum sp.]MDR3437772.1 NAD(P)H-dependent oxidoreductase [Telmatospirillum sp.]
MMPHRPRILGIAASLRNARWGCGGHELVQDLARCADKDALLAYLKRQSELHLENFLQAGRAQGLAFNAIAANLQKNSGTAGLSNSEVALASALWSAQRLGADVDHVSLAEYFSPMGGVRDGDALRQNLLSADGIVISGPVYFGDRGSLAESLIDFIARDEHLRHALSGRLYGGIAVGAKRNGGQETTLIYQMLDMLNLGFLAVGNDSETTAQYGGTGHAGDVGTMHRDTYGIDTSMGLGRRMAQVLTTLCNDSKMIGGPRVLFAVLQDDIDGLALRETEALVARLGNQVEASVVDISASTIHRCIACDICPTHVGLDSEYRCIITSATDAMSDLHALLLDHDMIVPVLATSRKRERIVSAYQTFIERTRYLRRSDYVWSDLLVAPLILQESGTMDSAPIRVMTSFIRHHTVMTRPVLGVYANGIVLNRQDVDGDIRSAIGSAARLTAGRLQQNRLPAYRYHPVGYMLSSEKDAEDEKLKRREALITQRRANLAAQAAKRLAQ